MGKNVYWDVDPLNLKKICIQNFRKDCRPRSRRGASLRFAPLANEGVLLNFVIFCGVGVLGLGPRVWIPVSSLSPVGLPFILGLGLEPG